MTEVLACCIVVIVTPVMEINLISAMLMKGLFFLKKNVSQVLLRRHLTKRSVLSSETYQAYSMKLNANFPKYLSLYACQVLFLLLSKLNGLRVNESCQRLVVLIGRKVYGWSYQWYLAKVREPVINACGQEPAW